MAALRTWVRNSNGMGNLHGEEKQEISDFPILKGKRLGAALVFGSSVHEIESPI